MEIDSKLKTIGCDLTNFYGFTEWDIRLGLKMTTGRLHALGSPFFHTGETDGKEEKEIKS